MMSRSRPGRVRCAFGLTFVPVLAYALLGSLGACDYVAYLGNYEVPDGTVTDAGPDIDVGIDASVPCGPKSCVAPATCLDPQGKGKCSNDILSMSAGAETTCAVMANGTLWCWGGNQFGTLGVPSDGNEKCRSYGMLVACRDKPAPVPGLEDVIQVSVGNQSACAVKRDNSVWCWGGNASSQLGHASGEAGDHLCLPAIEGDAGEQPVQCNPVPTRVDGLAAVEVAVNRDHACAIKTDGSVACWGKNEAMALGSPGFALGASTPIPQPVALKQPILHLGTGVLSHHTCAIDKERGAVWCWGANHRNQLGHPRSLDTECSSNCSSTPSAVGRNNGDAGPYDPLENVTSVSAGYLFTCAVRDQRVYCWGSNDFGTLSENGPKDKETFKPVSIPFLPLATKIESRFAHVCALTDEAQVHCWGGNILGSVGMGTILGEQCVSGLCKLRAYNTNIIGAVDVAAGGATGYALLGDGGVLSWGDNSTARLGHAQGAEQDFIECGDSRTSVCNPTPRPIPQFP